MKRKALFALFVPLFFLFISCSITPVVPDFGLVLDFSDPIAIRDGSVFAPNSLVKLAWKGGDGKALNANVSIFRNGVLVMEFLGVTEAVFGVEEEGSYEALIAVGGVQTQARSNSLRVSFSVNRLWEELFFSSNGIILLENISNLILPWVLDGKTPAIAFYKLGQQFVGETAEVENFRERLALVDTNEDGVFDAWQEVSAFGDQWIELPIIPTQFGNTIIRDICYEEKSIRILSGLLIDGPYEGYYVTFGTGIPFATVGLELNWPYTRGVFSMEEHLGDWDYGKILKLRERYDSDSKPEFELDLPAASSFRNGESFTVNVEAANVASFASVYNTRFMQIAVQFSKNLELLGVDFSNFMPGLNDVSDFQVFEEEDCYVVVLYRSFLEGEDELTAVSEVFAGLNFGVVGEDAGWVAFPEFYDYSGYGTLCNVLFRDTENKNVDGFRFDFDSFIEVIPEI